MKVGYAALIGKPNVGKSSLMNRFIKAKVSITSNKPQTTRTRILGIDTDDHAQIIYVDTPGWQDKIPKALNRYMNRRVQAALTEVDLILWVIDATQFNQFDEQVGQLLQSVKKPIILLMNKIDLIPNKSDLLPKIESLSKQFEWVEHFFPISAKSESGFLQLRELIIRYFPEGEIVFPEDEYTDKTENELAAEMIREKLFRLTKQEIPYSLTVSIDQLEKTSRCVKIQATIWVEREGQKAIVIGKQGQLLKEIGTEARRDMEQLFDQKVFLNVWVKVKNNWTDEESDLIQLGYE